MAAETIRMSQLLSPNAGDPKIEVSSASDDQGQPEKAGTGASEPSMIRTNKHGSYCLIDDPLPPSKDSDPRNEELSKGEAGVTAGSIQPTLEKQLAVLSGGMDSTRPILVLPAVGLKKLDSGAASMEEMIKTLLYFKHLLSGGIQSFGITIVMDARSTKTHTPTKTILEDMAAGKFPFVAQKLIVLQKASLMGFGRPKVLATPEVTKKLKVVFVGEKDSIEQYVDASQLTSDLGGTLCYDHMTWVSNRVEFERLAEMYSTAMEKVPQLAAAMNQFDVPESVEEAERLMQDSLQKKEKLVQLISQAELSMDVMLSQLQKPRPEVLGMAMTKDYNSMLSSISHMLDTLKGEEERHDRFWALHKCRIDHMMQLCHFKRTVEKDVEFGMYFDYCKNKTNSENLMNESTESQAFFKNLQLRMGDGLPLHTYLIKPVQRVTKYQLLLKDMIKHSKNAPAALDQLQSALDRMLKVLKSLNDSLHVVGLKGYPGSLAEQGRLLLHDPFTLRESSGKIARGKQQRHMFLFEKVIIFTKKREVPSQKVREKKTDCYFYKEHIQMAGIGLRPLLDHHPLQFDITVHGQNRVIKFQSASKEARDLWVSEIRRLLELQFTLIKEIAVNSGTLDRRVYKGGKASLKPMSSKFALADSLRRDSAPPVQIIKKTRTDRFRLNWKKKESKPPPPKASQTLSVTHSLPIVGMRRRDGGHLTDIREDVVKTPESGESVSSDEDIPFSEEEEEEEEETTGGALEFHYDSLAPRAPRHYKAIANFNQLEQENSVSLTVDQEVEVIGINQYGWWWVRATNNVTGETEEGWAPASYLQVMQKPLPLQT